MGVTAHWLTQDFALRTRCLAVKPAPGRHTADFISAELYLYQGLNTVRVGLEQLHVHGPGFNHRLSNPTRDH